MNIMKTSVILCILGLGAGLVSGTGTVATTNTSALWSVSGEAWSPASRLPYFGSAGYKSGQ